MDFFRQQEQARRKSALLVLYFVLALAFLVLSVYGVALFLVGYFGNSYVAQYAYRGGWWDPQLFAWVAFGVLGLVALGSLFKTLSLLQGGAVVAQSLGGVPVQPATRDPLERRLLNVVEEMAIASGTRVPEVYVLPKEPGINAFAAGHTANDAVVAVTRGALETLSRDELQGVVGHEFSHIFHGDTRLNLKLIGILHGILLLGLAGRMLMVTGSSRRSSSNKGGGGVVLIGVALWAIGSIGLLFGSLIKAAVSRQREYLADASAVQYTRNPPGIAGALKKIGAAAGGARLTAPRAAEASHMYFADGLKRNLSGWLATHPPLTRRIRRIEPGFSGEFPALVPAAATASAAAAGFVQAPAAGAQVAGAALPYRQIVDQVGELDLAHLDHAERLLGTLPAELRLAAEEPFAARALVYGLLLHAEPAPRERQVDHLKQAADPKVLDELRRLLPALKRVTPAQRLPLADLTLPALRRLAPRQYQDFRRNVKVLIEADRRVSLFEYALHRLLLRHLDLLFGKPVWPVSGRTRLDALADPAGILLAALAWAGQDDAAAAGEAYAAAQAELGGVKLPPLVPAAQAGLAAVDSALTRLARLAPAGKHDLLAGAAACVSHAGKVTVAEGELLRVLADALDLPVPAVVGLVG